MKVTLSRNEDISWYVEGHCLVDLNIFCILATVSLRTSSETKILWSLDMRLGRGAVAWRWKNVEVEGECFVEAWVLLVLVGGSVKRGSFVGTSLACFLLDWACLMGMLETSLKICWLDCIETSSMPMVSKVSPKTTTSSSVDWLVWTEEIDFCMVNRKFFSEEGVLSLGHSMYHPEDWRWGKPHSCTWCIVKMWPEVVVSVHIQKKGSSSSTTPLGTKIWFQYLINKKWCEKIYRYAIKNEVTHKMTRIGMNEWMSTWE